MATAFMPGRAPRAPAAAGVQLAFRLRTATLSLELGEGDCLRLVQDAYAPMLVTASSARAHACLRRLSDGRLNVRYGRQVLQTNSAVDAVPERAVYHAAREIFARFACEPAQTLALYGALCAVDGGAVLLLGPTTIGKTVLALHLAHRGARFLGDDTALLSLASEEAYALPRRPSLRESALPLLPDAGLAQAVMRSTSVFATERGRFWYALGADVLPGVEPCERVYALRAVCVIANRAQTPSIRRLDPSEAVKCIAQRAYARPTTLTQTGAIRRAIRRAACFEMTIGAPDESSELLLREVRACG